MNQLMLNHPLSRLIIPMLVSVLLLLPACASGPRKSPLNNSEAASSLAKADQCIDRGEYRKALELYARANCGSDSYGKCANGMTWMRGEAEQAYLKKNFVTAGSIYRFLLENRFSAEHFQQLAWNEEYLRKQIKSCSKELLETGLLKYREEKLEDAISTWKKILTFDPGNESALNAVDTANRQLHQLKDIR